MTFTFTSSRLNEWFEQCSLLLVNCSEQISSQPRVKRRGHTGVKWSFGCRVEEKVAQDYKGTTEHPLNSPLQTLEDRNRQEWLNKGLGKVF